MRILKKRILFGVLVLICSMFSGCEQKMSEKTILEVGENGQEQYDGVAFAFEIKDEGAIVNNISPNSGTKLVFPEMLGGHSVIGVSEQCVFDYEEIKFAGVKNIWNRENKSVKKISFYSGVELGKYDFSKFQNLEEVSLPEGLKQIDTKMFKGCDKLKKVYMPDTVEKIDFNAFAELKALDEINIPENVKFIGTGAFRNCVALKSIVFPKGLEEIARETCSGCVELTEVVFPEKLKKIDDKAFMNCSSLACDLDFRNISSIGNGAFANCIGLKGRNVNISSDALVDRKHWDIICDEYYNYEEVTKLNVIPPFDKTFINVIGCDDYEKNYFNGELKVIDVMNMYDILYCWPETVEDKLLCNQSEFSELVYQNLHGRVLKKGEGIVLSEIKPIVEMIVDSGKLSGYNYQGDGPDGGERASRYGFIERLNYALSGTLLERKEDVDVGWYNTGVEYKELADDFVLVNDRYEEVDIQVKVVESAGGSNFYVYFFCKE